MRTKNTHEQDRPRARATRLLCVCLTLFPTSWAAAQASHSAPADEPRVTVHALLGAFLPTGDHRRSLGDAPYIGAQAALRVRERLALVGGLAASQTTDGRVAPGERGVTLWQYDAGVELAPWSSAPTARERSVMPFVGTGIGARTYDYSRRGLARHDALAGYLSAGAELRPGVGRRAGLRAEARAYVSHPERAGSGNVRTDVVLAAGLTEHLR